MSTDQIDAELERLHQSGASKTDMVLLAIRHETRDIQKDAHPTDRRHETNRAVRRAVARVEKIRGEK